MKGDSLEGLELVNVLLTEKYTKVGRNWVPRNQVGE